MSSYDVDTISLITVTTDETYGTKTESASVDHGAEVIDKSELIRNNTGNEITSKMLIFMDPDVIIKPSDYLIIKKRWDTLTGDNTKYEVIKTRKVTGFSPSHIEVWL